MEYSFIYFSITPSRYLKLFQRWANNVANMVKAPRALVGCLGFEPGMLLFKEKGRVLPSRLCLEKMKRKKSFFKENEKKEKFFQSRIDKDDSDVSCESERQFCHVCRSDLLTARFREKEQRFTQVAIFSLWINYLSHSKLTWLHIMHGWILNTEYWILNHFTAGSGILDDKEKEIRNIRWRLVLLFEIF